MQDAKADLFKGLSHPIRIRALELISSTDEISVTELLEDMGIEPSHLSQHLAVLRKHQLVTSTRRGSQVYYRIAYPQVAQFLEISRDLLRNILTTTREQLEGAE